MTTDFTGLLDQIENSLRPWNYEFIIHTNQSLNNIDFVGCIMTSRRWMTRYICGIIEIPKDVISHQDILTYADRALKTLSDQYTQFPYWKELGTYLVILCNAKQYKTLSVSEGEFKHKSGFHTNVWLGTILIDKENFQTVGQKTWGLYSSGKHYEAIKMSVGSWCEENRQAKYIV